MTTAVSQSYEIDALSVTSRRANALAERLEQGARALVDLATALTDTEWQTRIPGDGRKIGVVVHHVATMYPLEVQLAQALAQRKPIEGVTWDVVHEINARHATENDTVTICFAATAQPPPPRFGRSATRSWMVPPRCRSTPMRRSRASSCSRTTRSGTATTTLPRFGRR